MAVFFLFTLPIWESHCNISPFLFRFRFLSYYSTAVLVPFRDRVDHLRALLPFLHRFLQRQRIEYKIYVISQVR